MHAPVAATENESEGTTQTMDASLREKQVVTAFLAHEGRVLVLRRSTRVSTYRGRWAGVSGTIDPPHTPEEQARTEISEETSLPDDALTLVATGEPLRIVDRALGTEWVIHPFLYVVRDPDMVRLDWEHVESSWVLPEELAGRETVPGLAEALERVWS